MRGYFPGAQSSDEGRSMFQSRLEALREYARCCLRSGVNKAGFAPDAMRGARYTVEGQMWQEYDRRGSTKQYFGIAKLLRRVG